MRHQRSGALGVIILVIPAMLVLTSTIQSQGTVRPKRYLKKLRAATFRGIERAVDPVTGLPTTR